MLGRRHHRDSVPAQGFYAVPLTTPPQATQDEGAAALKQGHMAQELCL